MRNVKITIEATEHGVETIVLVDGKEVGRQREVPCDGGCECQHDDWIEQIKGFAEADELGEFMDDKFTFIGLDLLQLIDA